jgi:hypothetical protein
MGAELWYHQAPWHPDAEAALKALQASFLDENYDLPTLLPRVLADARESVRLAKEDGDPYGLVGIYQRKVDLLEGFCRQSLPDEAEARIDILRRIEAASGDEVGNVLDLTHVSQEREERVAQLLGEPEIERLVGVPRPGLEQARRAIDDIHAELHRGQAVCFPVYDNGEPVGWFFIGNTSD